MEAGRRPFGTNLPVILDVALLCRKLVDKRLEVEWTANAYAAKELRKFIGDVASKKASVSFCEGDFSRNRPYVVRVADNEVLLAVFVSYDKVKIKSGRETLYEGTDALRIEGILMPALRRLALNSGARYNLSGTEDQIAPLKESAMG